MPAGRFRGSRAVCAHALHEHDVFLVCLVLGMEMCWKYAAIMIFFVFS